MERILAAVVLMWSLSLGPAAAFLQRPPSSSGAPISSTIMTSSEDPAVRTVLARRDYNEYQCNRINFRKSTFCSAKSQSTSDITSAFERRRLPRSGWPEGLWRDLGRPLVTVGSAGLRDSHLNLMERHLASPAHRFVKVKVVLSDGSSRHHSTAIAREIKQGLTSRRMNVDILQIRSAGILLGQIDALLQFLTFLNYQL